jgi:peroxiredoxin, ohr subfamily
MSLGGRDGHVKNADGQIDLDLKTPGLKDNRKGTTPEDLFACGYAACFNGALGAAMRIKRVKTEEAPTVEVEISLGKNEDGSFQLAANIGARIPGVDEKLANELLHDAHNICPYSRATRGNIEAKLYLIK